MKTAIRLFALTIAAVLLLVSLSLSVSGEFPGTRQELILRIGVWDDLRTSNYLQYSEYPDAWTANVLAPVFGRVGMLNSDTLNPIPYLLRGVDADRSGSFDLDEYGVYANEAGVDPLNVTAYYDFNGVRTHDGVQVTVNDLLFSYHAGALLYGSDYLDVLKDLNGHYGGNYSTTHWLHVWPVGDSWDPSIPVGSDANLTFALHFHLQVSYINFVKYTLNSIVVLPRHIWEGTGRLCLDASNGTCANWKEDIHDDFGFAYDQNTGNGVPAASPNAFRLNAVSIWTPSDDEVIGIGPFVFDEWVRGVSASLVRFGQYKTDAPDCKMEQGLCQGEFVAYLHEPYIDGMQFKIYLTSTSATYVLQAGEIDLVPGSIDPWDLGDLIYDSDIGISTIAEEGFTYVGYNMAKSPFGYPDNDPSQGDHGLYLRKAVSHVTDKDVIVRELLRFFGYPGTQVVSPSYSQWHNNSVPLYQFNLSIAEQILDDHYTIGGFALGYAPSGYRNLPTIGDEEIEVLCPNVSDDAILAMACSMITANLRSIGVNAVANMVYHPYFGAPDMWIGVLRSFYYLDYVNIFHSHFYSGNAGGGWNRFSFQNETFDRCVTELRETQDSDRQTELIKWCSGILAENLPMDVLYFRKNAEVYRSDRFVNWTGGSAGSIFTGSISSWLGIHPPQPAMTLSLSAPSAITSLGTAAIKVAARELDNDVIPGLEIEICAVGLPDPGSLTIGGTTGSCVSGISDINGRVVAQYAAPYVSGPNASLVQIVATAMRDDWDYDEEKAVIRIYAEEEKFLSIRIDMEVGDVVSVGHSLPIGVEVTDQHQVPVNGATVRLSSNQSGLVLEPSGGTTVDGSIGKVLVTAPLTIPEDVDYLEFEITATAELDGYHSANATTGLIVFVSESLPPQNGHVDGASLWYLLPIGVVGLLALVWAVWWILRRSSRNERE